MQLQPQMFNKWGLDDLSHGSSCSPPSVTVESRPQTGELAAFSVEQDVQMWLQDASLWNAVANTNELPHVTRHLLCGQSWDWAGSPGEFQSHSNV